MKFLIRKNKDRIHKQDAWKRSAYAFVPYQTNFGELCGFADDVVEPGQGFGMHPHKNMEITTIVISGSQIHKDNTGSEGTVDPNCVQTMSGGTGIMHSEYNGSSTEAFHSFQIWVYPKVENVQPRHAKFSYSGEDKQNKVLLALSPDGRQGTAMINQDAFFSVSKLEKGHSLIYKMNLENNGVYLHCATGSVEAENIALESGDAIGVYDTASFLVTAQEDAALIFVEVPMHRGIKI